MLQITPEDFISLFNGHWCDWDGSFGNQCFDLAQFWNAVIGNPNSFTGATADLIYNQPGNFYTQVPNQPNNFPVKGDIVVWNWPHVGICTGNNTDANKVEVLEQNDPTDSNCHVKQYTYDGVIGWLHPNQLPQSQQQIIDQLRTDRDNNWNLYQASQTELTQSKTTCDNLNQQINDRNNDITTLNGQLKTAQTQIDSLEQQIATLQPIATQVPNLKSQLSQAEIDRQQALDANVQLNIKIKNMQATIDSAKPKTFIDKIIYLFS